MSDEPAHKFEFVPASPDLTPYLNSLYILTVGEDGLEEMLPAYSGQLLLVVEGSGRMDFGEGPKDAPDTGFLIGPLSSARRFVIKGPALILGASFNFHGWAAIAKLPVAESCDRFIELDTAFGSAGQQRLGKIAPKVARGRRIPRDALAEISAVLGSNLQPLPTSHAELVETTYQWLSSGLNPATEALYDALSLSSRQAQRLVGRFFGLPPSRLKRRFRAIRAATLLADPDLPRDMRLDVLEAFYDQAHMIREIREFTGRTPSILTNKNGSVISQTLGPKGYSVVDLFGGNEEEQLARGED